MPKMSILQQLADFFNLTIERLINQDLTRDEVSGVRVPVLGAALRRAMIIWQNRLWKIMNGSVRMKPGGEYFYLDVVGDSMKNARIEEGDRVYIHRQNSVDNGQIAVVLLENDEVTLKRVFYKDGNMILQPENDAYEPIVVPLKDVMDRRVQILGRLVHNKIRY